MSVNFFPYAPSYNKAPEPSKKPNPNLFPITKVIQDTQPVWVSLPLPDKLHLTIRLEAEHFVSWYKPNDPQEYGRMLMQAMALGLAGEKLNGRYSQLAQIWTQVQISLAGSGEPVFFQLARTKNDADGPHTLSVQMNPAKLGEAGCFEFLHQLHKATDGRFLVGRALTDARVARLDVAVDVLGVAISDVIMSVAKAKSERAWRKVDGGQETLDFFASKKTKSGAIKVGAQLATAYDKQAQLIAASITPPFGDAPVTRIEARKQRFGAKPFYLTDLLHMTNPLSGIKVGHVRSAVSPPSNRFLRYVTLRRSCSASRAAQLLSLSQEDAEAYGGAMTDHPADLFHGKEIWKGWQAGLTWTGLSLLIEAAQTGSAAVPYPDLADVA